MRLEARHLLALVLFGIVILACTLASDDIEAKAKPIINRISRKLIS